MRSMAAPSPRFGRLGGLLPGHVAGPALVAFALLGLAGGFLEAALLVLRAPVAPRLGDVVRIVAALLPGLAALLVPAAFLVGITVAAGRWRADGTWTALRALGVPARRLLPRLLLAGAVLSVATGGLTHLAAPAGRRAAARALAEAAAEVRLVPGRFATAGDAVVHRDLDGGVFLAAGDLAASARSGGLGAEGDRVVFALEDGVLAGPSGLQVAFARGRVPLTLPRPDRRVEIEERSDREIAALVARMRASGRDPSAEATILWKRTTLPLLCLLLPWVALPLGLRWGGRPAHAMGVVVATWTLVRTGDALHGVLGPPAAASLPLAGLGLLAGALWIRWRDR